MSDEPAVYDEACEAQKVNVEPNDWWKHVIVYQVYPRSFQDTKGDGIGDIQGIISRLNHFVFLNIGAIWICPIYKSPMVDHGYDISNFIEIDPVFGTMRDFDKLIEEFHKKKIRVIMDFVPNHTSNQHPWFIESSKGGQFNQFEDFYIWKDGIYDDTCESMKPPNNWISLVGGSAWTWVESRKQFYFHTFAPEQPDLNYRNKRVLQEMKNILKFWLSHGVDGFRVDAPVHLIKHKLFLDEPRSKNKDVACDHPDFLEHIYTACQPEVHDIMSIFRHVLKKYYFKTGKYIFMAAEVYQESECMKFYNSGSDMPLNLSLVTLKGKLTGLIIMDLVKPWIEAHKQQKWANFALGNHDHPRIATRLGEKFVDLMNVLLLLLPGTPTTYYGEEIGMMDNVICSKQSLDPYARNLGSNRSKSSDASRVTDVRGHCRGPMQWDDSRNSGFSSAKRPWLPVHPMFIERNVEDQINEGPHTHINIYRAASILRQLKTFQEGLIQFSMINENVFSFWRYIFLKNDLQGQSCYLVTMNVGDVGVSCDYANDTAKNGLVALDTHNPKKVNSVIPLNNVELDSGQCIVLEVMFF